MADPQDQDTHQHESRKTAVPGEAGTLKHDPELKPRDPEDRPVQEKHEIKEKTFDKTLADSFPTSDPPSSIPDPEEDDTVAA